MILIAYLNDAREGASKTLDSIVSSFQANRDLSFEVFIILSCTLRKAPRPSPYSGGILTPKMPRNNTLGLLAWL